MLKCRLVSERTFRRWRDRFEAEGAEGLFDRRLGRAAGNRVPVDAVMEVLELFDTRYWDFTARHFYDKLVETHDFKLSYNWVRITSAPQPMTTSWTYCSGIHSSSASGN